MNGIIEKLEFEGGSGAKLAARFDRPSGDPVACALFAHCFTCSKDILAARAIAGELAARGIGVVRFDFTGLGSSEGEFASTNFSSNVGDLVRAADHMRETLAAPALLIGHSLGGAAVLAAAKAIPEVKAVATIGAPADADHVVKSFAADVAEIETKGEAPVSLAGRTFTIRKQFLDDVKGQALVDDVAALRCALLFMHGPLDRTVGIDNATRLFTAARHPKSFVSLDDADHLLSKPDDGRYAARVIAAWASRYLPRAGEGADTGQASDAVVVEETHAGRFEVRARAGRHRLAADEPESIGGDDRGPSPYDYLSIGLGACTVMTMRMYADRKGWEGLHLSAEIAHGKVHAEDCVDCAGEVAERAGKIDRFERRIAIAGTDDDEKRAKLVEIANKCPVHRTLTESAAVVTYEAGSTAEA